MFQPLSLALAVLFFTPALFAQETPPQNPAPVALPEITVLGDSNKTSPLDFMPTVDEISGTRLERKKQTSLGETLSHETGVSSSFFGPNASRPVIRGMDGERIRVLNNGTGVLDASAASQDHEVAVEPMAVERIEIVRGPSALLYGSSAVGGVVNVITNRIPEAVADGFNGKVDSRYSSNDNGGATGAAVNYGLGHWSFHADGTLRSSGDYHAPGYQRTQNKRDNDALEADETEGYNKIINSANNTSSGALGGSYVFDRGYAGASYSHYDSLYGTVAEQHVKIKMKQDKTDAALALKDVGLFESIRLKNTYSDYRHEEIDHDEVGTVFTNRGDEARLEMKHKALGNFTGVWGLQSNFFTFAAVGDEKFLPQTDNQSLAAFAYEEAQWGRLKPSFGLRVDQAQVKADQTFIQDPATDPSTLPDDQRYGAGEKKDFTAVSASLGGSYALDESNSLVLNLAYSERAPNYQELFANGPHLATDAYERGDTHLGKEQSHSLEFSYRHKDDDTKASVGAFLQDFKNFIALSPTAQTGFNPDDPTDPVQLYRYTAINARFWGAEADVSHELPHLIPGGVLELGLKFDMVKAQNTDTRENLPRITPLRETVSAVYKANSYTADAEIQHVEKQNDTAPNETATDAYTLVNLGVETPIHWDVATLSVYGRVNNLFDAVARNHVSVLKEIAPLPGRNFILGVQALF